MNDEVEKNDFDFDQVIDRAHTDSLKYSGRQKMFGDANVIPLWVADMDFKGSPAITAALINRANHPIYGYAVFPESLFEALMGWFCHRHGWQIKREWIVMCPGVVPSLHAAIMAFTNPGDSVIVQPPVYFPFFSAVTETGRNLVLNPLIQTSLTPLASGLNNSPFSIDFEHFEACAASAKMLLFCSPHNPVGRVWRKDELMRLLNIAEKYDLIVLSDEIHADLVYPDGKHHILASLSEGKNNIITAVAPSKTFNIPGLNLSALIIPDATQRNSVTKVFDSLHLSTTNPFSIVAFESAYKDGAPWLDALLGYLKETRDFVIQYMRENCPNIHVIQPEGTYLLWLDCRALGMNDVQLQQFFIEKSGVGLSPGILFGEAGSGYMRMNIAAPRQVIASALELILKAIKPLHTTT